ncbi:TIGR03790 family protein [Paucibacter sp. AS339]|uniref:TIGR03790 family protein n=1 Tax=Paucibacter hankyongi TaxID=3133434 RepID=UPI0030A95F72
MKNRFAPREGRHLATARANSVWAVLGLVLGMQQAVYAQAQAQAATAASAPAASASAPVSSSWLRMPRLQGRLSAADLGLLINTADPYSVAIGAYYAERRAIPEQNIVRVKLPLRASLSADEFSSLQAQIQSQMGPQVQALALAWRQPYAVECNAITAALGMGFQPEICAQSCVPSKLSPYISYQGSRPFSDLGMRPAMMLAARSIEAGQALIDRGIAADQSLPAFTPVNAYFVSTPDAARNVRSSLFPPATALRPWGIEVKRASSQALPALQRTLVYQTGLIRVEGLSAVDWVPGALADHLTSFGGLLEASSNEGQMSALDWLEAGATASYGTVSEPCNHRQKFPHPQILLLSYVQGVTALEAYWHSVAWPGQGVFIGEPLAAPFAPKFGQP